MNRLSLSSGSAQRTRHFVLFEQELKGLNDFYWLYRSASALLMQQSTSYARTSDFVPEPEALRLNIACHELAEKGQQADRVARYGLLVQVITYFEEYLSRVLCDVCSNHWPRDKQVTIKINPSDLPSTNLEEYIRSAAIAAKVKLIIDKRYDERFKAVCKLLNDFGYQAPAKKPARAALVVAACEVRNCVVHGGGRIDARAYRALNELFPCLTIGTQLDLDESRLWQLLGAVRDDARAIDCAVRKPVPAGLASRKSRKMRATARRRQNNLVQMKGR